MTAADDYARALRDLASRQRRSDNAITRAHADVNEALATMVLDDHRALEVAPLIEQTSWAPGDQAREQHAVDGPYQPPSVADGTVSARLVAALRWAIDEYGYRGVFETLTELGAEPLPEGGWITSPHPIVERRVLAASCPACHAAQVVPVEIAGKLRLGELSLDLIAVHPVPHTCTHEADTPNEVPGTVVTLDAPAPPVVRP